jgi:hypothetical protein
MMNGKGAGRFCINLLVVIRDSYCRGWPWCLPFGASVWCGVGVGVGVGVAVYTVTLSGSCIYGMS